MPASSTFSIVVMLGSLAISIAAYLAICRKDGSYVNVFTPTFLVAIPAQYLLPFVYLALYGAADGTSFATAYCYLTYAATFVATALGYVVFKPVNFGWASPSRRLHWLPWALVAAAVFLYLPILWEYREFILSPRQIYMQTRTGYGPIYYGSSFFCNIGLMLYLMEPGRTRRGTLLFTGLAIGITFLHGSKGQLLTLIVIWLLYRVYVQGRKFARFWKAVFAGLALSAAVLAMFAAFASADERLDFVSFLANYSDYSRNAMTVIDDRDLPRYWGQLTLETQVYGVLPRVLFPNKPKNFGDFRLAERYYPEWFDADTGAPDFNIGIQYADFGIFAVVYLSAWGMLSGILARSFVERLRKYPNPANLVMVAFLSGVSLIPAPGYLLAEHLVIAASIAWLLQASHRRELGPVPQSA